MSPRIPYLPEARSRAKYARSAHERELYYISIYYKKSMGRARALGRVPLLLVILAVPVLNAHRPQTADDVHLNFKTILIRCFLK